MVDTVVTVVTIVTIVTVVTILIVVTVAGVKLRRAHQTSTLANLLLSMLWLGIAESNSLTRKTTGLAPITSSKLHRPKFINNNDMVVNKNMSTSHSADLLRPES